MFHYLIEYLYNKTQADAFEISIYENIILSINAYSEYVPGKILEMFE